MTNKPKGQTGSKGDSTSRRGTEDQERDKLVYKFLLSCLTDLVVSEKTGRPNEYGIAEQWGQKQNRIYIRRVLRSVLAENYPEEERENTVPGLTLGKLVEILTGIEAYRKKQKSKTPETQIPRILTRSEKLTALRKFSQLLLEEQEKLNLPMSSEDLLLQQLIETITDPVRGLEPGNRIFFYKNALKIYEDLKKVEISAKISNWQAVQQDKSPRMTKLIETKIAQILEEYYQGINEEIKRKKLKELSEKVQREVNSIEYKSGTRQVKQVLERQDRDNISDAFIERLTVSILENDILIKEFPIHIDYFEIERLPTLPLYIDDIGDLESSTNSTKTRLLNSKLLDKDEDWKNIKGLEKQLIYNVKVYFSVKLPSNYTYRFGEEQSQKISIFNKNGRLKFCQEITGIGSSITHIIAAINKFLLWDIPALKEYLPVARELLNKDEVIGQSTNSPVLSYRTVTLCKKEDVEKAISKDKEYDKVATDQDLAYGEYCGFDLVEASAKAARYARLKAIKQTGINPREYLTQLCHKLEEKNALMKAESYLEFYPFSLRAMEGYINETIFKDKYRKHDKKFNFTEINPGEPWSLVAYDAHLKITAAYLREGLYRIAKKFLDAILSHIENNRLDDHLLLAKYHFCQFRYYYLTDSEDREYYPHPERTAAARKAEEHLDVAEKQLTECLREYQKIGEASQTNFSPFFYLISRVFAHRMKLYLFTPLYAPRPQRNHGSLREALSLSEKARIYAARDGSTAHYAYWTAYQAWCYLMTAYLEPEKENQSFTKENCLNWARKLIDHAKRCYSYTGEKCYKQIKDNAGRIKEDAEKKPILMEGNEEKYSYYQKYGDVNIQVMPLIQEKKAEQDRYNLSEHILTIDLSDFIINDNPPTYLFGHHSAIILFVMGMLELCDDENDVDKLKEKIQRAKKLFVCCLSIAAEGGEYQSIEKKDNELYINRNPRKQTQVNSVVTNNDEFDSWIKILYPHRLTQFADLGKIFAATCKAILLLSDSEYKYDQVQNLLENLRKNPINPPSEKNLGQKLYNGHLESTKRAVIDYYRQLQDEPISGSLTEIRDRVVEKVFTIIRS